MDANLMIYGHAGGMFLCHCGYELYTGGMNLKDLPVLLSQVDIGICLTL